MNSIFDNEKLNEQLKHLELNPPKHYIGIHIGSINPNYDDPHSYCLFRKTGKNITLILQDTMTDYELFGDTVHNLTKYFKAERIIFKHD